LYFLWNSPSSAGNNCIQITAITKIKRITIGTIIFVLSAGISEICGKYGFGDFSDLLKIYTLATENESKYSISILVASNIFKGGLSVFIQ
jgi:hypothetical protein